LVLVISFLLQAHPAPLALHSFPTRRSSDLGTRTVDADAELDASPERDSPARAVEPQPVEPSAHPPQHHDAVAPERHGQCAAAVEDRKSTRLNSSHRTISYAVFCLKKKKRRH